MRGGSVLWGVPDFGRVAFRNRLINQLEGAGDRLRLIVAPSGWGKTLLAAQYAQRTDDDVLWIDAGGQQVSCTELAAEILRRFRHENETRGTVADVSEATSLSDLLDACKTEALARFEQDGSRLLVIVDDVADGPDHTVEQLAGLHRAFFGYGIRVLVTAREAASCSIETSQRSVSIGARELRVEGLTEAREILEAAGYRSPVDVGQLLEQSAGHVVLFLLMAREALAPVGSTCVEGLPNTVAAWVGCVMESTFEPSDYDSLLAIALLKRGASEDLFGLGVQASVALLDKASTRMPLIRVSVVGSRRDSRMFSIHDIAEAWILERFDHSWSIEHTALLERVTSMLVDSGRLGRAAVLASSRGTEALRLNLLLSSGREMLNSYMVPQLRLLLESVSLHSLMEHPALLLLWAEVLLEEDEPEEAARKARAASELARHKKDTATVVLSLLVEIESLKRHNRHNECVPLANEVRSLIQSEHISDHVFLEALVCVGSVHACTGNLREAEFALSTASQRASASDAMGRNTARVHFFLALVRSLINGDFATGAAEMSRVLSCMDTWLSDRVTARGNLGAVMAEMGRLERAKGFIEFAMKNGSAYFASAFCVHESNIAAAEGHYDLAWELNERNERLCESAGCETDRASNRVCHAVCLRAAGQHEEALAIAEHSYEALSAVNFMGYRTLAGIEVAASLLSLGDVPAARRWTTLSQDASSEASAYNALRADMVLAECDRRDQDIASGIARLRRHRDHILSESSNWQMAMYCRAFPHLLGMLAAAVGAADLPTHMVRMVLPEYAEMALSVCREWLDDDEWRTLGRRTLGDADFARLEQRGGEPICRVRLFGGLEVALGDRVVSEADWRKRKTRLLFAMLVVRRGQDVPREQVIEYLWPDLSEERAKNNFYVAWSTMKSALMGKVNRSMACPYIENKGGRLRILTDAVRSDIDDFEEALGRAREAEAAEDASTALDAYAVLASTYAGDLLPGDIYDDWFLHLRESCRFRFVDAMRRAATLLLERDDPCEALIYSRRALAVDPLREDLYQLALRCQIAAGQRSGAIDTFMQCRSRLAEELGLDPSAETMALYQEILVMEDTLRFNPLGFIGRLPS